MDAGLAEAAARRLAEAGYHPRVVAADGEDGWAPEAPYDRVLCTASLQRVPFAWVEQTRPGGLVVTPWKTTLQPHGMVRLRVADDGASASGHFDQPMSRPLRPGAPASRRALGRGRMARHHRLMGVRPGRARPAVGPA
ncbi:hypothetical protein [Streptomyces sp. RTd22]|uniref:hypothetical protein n=1 Tax=Streptomyces sp. RTd22 TaxID=1841249 RepID=UPI001F397743|nr:hypothetical protein [Streptomyces sp. RTd22]